MVNADCELEVSIFGVGEVIFYQIFVYHGTSRIKWECPNRDPNEPESQILSLKWTFRWKWTKEQNFNTKMDPWVIFCGENETEFQFRVQSLSNHPYLFPFTVQTEDILSALLNKQCAHSVQHVSLIKNWLNCVCVIK